MSNTQILNQYGLTFSTVQVRNYGTENIVKSTPYPVLAEILNFLPAPDYVDDMIYDIDRVVNGESEYEDLTIVLPYIRILPDEIRMYAQENNNYEQPDILMSPNDFKAVLNEWKVYLQKNQ